MKRNGYTSDYSVERNTCIQGQSEDLMQICHR